MNITNCESLIPAVPFTPPKDSVNTISTLEVSTIASNPGTRTKLHSYPPPVLRSSAFKVKVDGKELEVLNHPGADFASFECDGPVEIQIEHDGDQPGLFIRPLNRDITPKVADGVVCFTIPSPQYLQIEFEGLPLLYLYALAPAGEPPSGKHVRRFAGGKIHEAGEILLGDGDVCWIDAGAIVRGTIRAANATGVRVGGYGILDGSYWLTRKALGKALVLDHCQNSRIETLLMLGPSNWMISIGACEGITVVGVRQIAINSSSDGVDIAGSKNIAIKGCCLHNGDDNIAIKAVQNVAGWDESLRIEYRLGDWEGPVENVVISDCMLYNLNGGSAMEIGYETRTERISNIHFENIDVLGVHCFGSVFGIHNGDRALVENILWENIRVEHHYDRLVDFRITKSRWNRDKERGLVRNVTLRNIQVSQSEHNAGYTLSMLVGCDAAHPVSGIYFENFKLGGVRVLSADQLDLVTRNADNITFK